MSPKVSVILPAYNAEKYVAQAVDSILGQTFNDFELIILNDGSTDNTNSILGKYTDSRIIYIENETNLGLTTTLNKGLTLARGSYIARQDADDISMPTRFKKQVEYLDKCTDIGLLGTSWHTIDEHGLLLMSKMMPTDATYIRNHILTELVLTHATIMFRKELIVLSNGYRIEAGSAEDLDLWLRLIEITNIANLPESLYQVRIHKESVVGSGLLKHLESIYHVRYITLARWYNNGFDKVPPLTIARCYMQMACHDFLMNRHAQGAKHLDEAIKINPFILNDPETIKDIGQVTLLACRTILPTPDFAQWKNIGQQYIYTILNNIPQQMKIKQKQLLSQFYLTAGFYAYLSCQYRVSQRFFGATIQADPTRIKNRGLWRFLAYSLISYKADF